MSDVLMRLHMKISGQMVKIANMLTDDYKLTLIARCTSEKYQDADILVSDDDAEKAIAAIKRLADRKPINEGGTA